MKKKMPHKDLSFAFKASKDMKALYAIEKLHTLK